VPTLPKALSDVIMMAVAERSGTSVSRRREAFRNALSQISGSAPVAASVGAAQPYRRRRLRHRPPVMTTPPRGGWPANASPGIQRCGRRHKPQVVRGSRHVGWMLAAAIVVLVALSEGHRFTLA